jgi:hypothetical protein
MMKSLPFKLLALAALLAVQAPAVAQTNGDTAVPAPGASKQAGIRLLGHDLDRARQLSQAQCRQCASGVAAGRQ